MAQTMKTISFENLLFWIFTEYKKNKKVFGIPDGKFFYKTNSRTFKIFNEELETPFGPAAGPHTQLTQNILTSYLVGGRFIELKTVQILDNLEIDKPCIDVEDEGYNVEWSQELSLEESFDEYLKAWILTHFLKKVFRLSNNSFPGFIFNMSVGYDLKGIQSERIDQFIELMKDASNSVLFEKYINQLINYIKSENFKSIDNSSKDELIDFIKNISPNISNSVTLSTMHGCPSDEIESIVKYLIKEKKLNTYVKLNPTLLGYNRVREILDELGYDYIKLKIESFEHDLKYDDAIEMIKRLKKFAIENGKEFGIKLSNTLGVINTKNKLPGQEMYLSGRTLFPLTINLAYQISRDLNGDIHISYSGGANIFNSKRIIQSGIFPVTYATDLLKPGGYLRLHQLVNDFENNLANYQQDLNTIDYHQLEKLIIETIGDQFYHKDYKETTSVKLKSKLPVFDCYIAPCEATCPINQDVSEYSYLVSQCRFEEAFETIIEKNPLPHITGYICDHQCMTKCTRWEYELPIQIRDIKKYATEKSYGNYLKRFLEYSNKNKNGIKVAIIGAGPAGLSAAYFLSRAGFDVTIFEKTDKAGGTVRHIIPQFRIPQEVIDKDIDFIRMHNVNIIYNSDPNLTVDTLKSQGYKYIFIGIGAEIPNELTLNSESKNIFDALDFLRSFNRNEKVQLGKIVAVIGGGNSAMDAARAAKRCEGVEEVYIIYRRTIKYMPADKEELEAAKKDGVKFFELLQPVEFKCDILKCQKMKLGEFDKDGRQKSIPIENAFEQIEVNSIIIAIGEHTDYDFLRLNKIAMDNKFNLLVNENTNETNIPNVFVGGDALRGPSTVIESISDGKKVAEEIIRREKQDCDFNLKKDYRKEMFEYQTENRGNLILPIVDELNKEASRCLMCDAVCNKCVEVCPNRANVSINVYNLSDSFNDFYQIVHIDKICNECGNCETFCPHQGMPYKNKFTIFSDIDEFHRSTNPGIFLDSDENIHLRVNNQIQIFNFDQILSNDLTSSLTLDKNYLAIAKELLVNYKYLFV